jgi:lysosomal acid lipase/cholesteryl ester hydrolase
VNKPVVICQHGILDSASCWILNGKRSIAFRLVEQGYDVWLNNSRGNWYSMEHTDYDPKAKGTKAFKKDNQK